MKENFKLGGILLVITALAGLLLGFANSLTKEAILENSKINKEDLKKVLPIAESIRDIDIKINEEGTVKEVYEAIGKSDVVGYVLKVTSKGFHGPVDFVVAISKDDKVSGVKVLAHSETPGLGAKITEDKFTSRFKDKSAKGYLEVVKKSTVKDSELEAISGATISSKAAVSAVNDAIKFYMENIKGEKLAPNGGTDANSGASEEAGAQKEEKATDANSGASEETGTKKEEKKSTDTNTGASEETTTSQKTDVNTGASES
ncbi:RnfABCDGE type electron transport complex subunit G [Clostridium septicum]|uniref:Ion-translocating oxidoreductase complex subunit G n=1 Tax=Clostridium septicum TaxID=1504 RepID=A0A9N7JIS8_CLOSE|nr:RnfABCDGE type electron transport complex subunit G [Clostridium septicum]AYE33188.1 RnfABCDGE type electron transport complex subunit G [Clostridium septicum]MDU1315115.1 RnfABCDGE type electron transport complex subunit G [Clostridium septicum]QAS61358.1 RnfABCDGE type electron transport complex subunit G [Clostridium septicum]UEC22210.1 RnfABCDGE type electron transport complex subunit G [Clostridium septicum]USR99761.1 RnfABCDGE type electron transport complex subunit G [Clostridium sep